MTTVNTPIRIGTHTVKNRITMAPTVKFDWGDETGKATERHAKHYTERAMRGVGLICVEAVAVTPEGRFTKEHMGLWNDEQIEGHKAITEGCHKYGATVIVQINHTGLQCNTTLGGEPVGPSAIECTTFMRETRIAHELTIDEIHSLQKAFVDAAVRAQKAGYDGVQLHGCHAYLINQFASTLTNFRTDEYGGSPENRARFGAEIITEIRKMCGPDFLISVRHTGYEASTEDAIAVADYYVKAGCDYLQISSGVFNWRTLTPLEGVPYNVIMKMAIQFREHFKGIVPVSGVNSVTTPELAKYLIENDLLDTVDIARGLLADPRFAEVILTGEGEYVKCFGCKHCLWGPFAVHKCPAARKRGAQYE